MSIGEHDGEEELHTEPDEDRCDICPKTNGEHARWCPEAQADQDWREER